MNQLYLCFFKLMFSIQGPMNLCRIMGFYFNIKASDRNIYLRFMKNSGPSTFSMHNATLKAIVGIKFDNILPGRLIQTCNFSGTNSCK